MGVKTFTVSAPGSVPRIMPFISRLRMISLLLVAGILLSWPAVWNRFPLMFYDTSSYVARSAILAKALVHSPKSSAQPSGAAIPSTDRTSVTGRISSNPFFLRPIFYSLWLVPFSLTPTFFLIPLGQGLLSAYVIYRLIRRVAPPSTPVFLGTIALLALVSSLPWHASYVMPDIFTGLVVAMSFVVMREWNERSWPGRILDVGLLTLGICVHLSHLPLTAGLIGVYLATNALIHRNNLAELARASAGVAAVGAALLLAAGLLVASNYAAVRKPTISESSPLFLLARLVGDGPARTYLAQACPSHHYRLCDEQSRFDSGGPGSVSDRFLWGADGTVKRLASPELLSEAQTIDRETIRTYPTAVTGNILRNGLLQVLKIQLDRALNAVPPPFVITGIDRISPRLGASALASRQATGGFPLQTLRIVQDLALAMAIVATASLAAGYRRAISPDAWYFVGTVALALVGNAIITGGLSDVHDRYENRIEWLVVICPVILGLSVWAARSRRMAESRASN